MTCQSLTPTHKNTHTHTQPRTHFKPPTKHNKTRRNRRSFHTVLTVATGTPKTDTKPSAPSHPATKHAINQSRPTTANCRVRHGSAAASCSRQPPPRCCLNLCADVCTPLKARKTGADGAEEGRCRVWAFETSAQAGAAPVPASQPRPPRGSRRSHGAHGHNSSVCGQMKPGATAMGVKSPHAYRRAIGTFPALTHSAKTLLLEQQIVVPVTSSGCLRVLTPWGRLISSLRASASCPTPMTSLLSTVRRRSGRRRCRQSPIALWLS